MAMHYDSKGGRAACKLVVHWTQLTCMPCKVTCEMCKRSKDYKDMMEPEGD